MYAELNKVEVFSRYSGRPMGKRPLESLDVDGMAILD